MKVFEKYRNRINGIIHCSGGAQTKVMKFIENLHVIKNNLFETPKLFRLIQKMSGTSHKEMYEVFNMGHRLEIFTDEQTASEIIEISKKFNVNARIIGHCDASKKNKLTIKSEFGEFSY